MTPEGSPFKTALENCLSTPIRSADNIAPEVKLEERRRIRDLGENLGEHASRRCEFTRTANGSRNAQRTKPDRDLQDTNFVNQSNPRSSSLPNGLVTPDLNSSTATTGNRSDEENVLNWEVGHPI
jgi:hypothetical protein